MGIKYESYETSLGEFYEGSCVKRVLDMKVMKLALVSFIKALA